MTQQAVGTLAFDFEGCRPVQIEVSNAPLTSDAGLLLFRQLDEQLRITEQFSAVLHDDRDPQQIVHSVPQLLRQRVYGILADYQDQNDHDALRKDPAFKLLAGRLPDGRDLASQPTLSRFENAVSIADLWILRDVLMDVFIQSFAEPPRHLTLDLDAFDDSTHGHQQLTLFHGFYGQYQYLPLMFTRAEGTNRRAVVTNRPGVRVLPEGVYEEYAMRGESENRNKELKCGLQADRLSDQRFVANFLRLYLHTIAYVLLIRARHVVALPLPTASAAGVDSDLPPETLPEPDRRDYFNHRRRSDPLGAGHIETWRSRIIKVAAEIVVSARRIVVKISATWPHLADFQRVLETIRALPQLQTG